MRDRFCIVQKVWRARRRSRRAPRNSVKERPSWAASTAGRLHPARYLGHQRQDAPTERRAERARRRTPLEDAVVLRNRLRIRRSGQCVDGHNDERPTERQCCEITNAREKVMVHLFKLQSSTLANFSMFYPSIFAPCDKVGSSMWQ